MTIQIFYFHPGYRPSKTNAAMIAAARQLPGVEVLDAYAAYHDCEIDVPAEAERLIGASCIVFQFPIHWYSTPALLKEWQDRVLTWMFYIEPGYGAKLQGKSLMVAATAGNVPSSYGPGGINLFPLKELLKPLQATANRCGLKWCEPFLVYRADQLNDEERAEVTHVYRRRLVKQGRTGSKWPPSFIVA